MRRVTGRFGRFVRRTAVAAGLLALCVPLLTASASAGEPAAGTPRCVAGYDLLPVPPESQWWPSGTIVGGSPSGRYLVGGDVLWVDGEPQVLNGSGSDTWLADVNNSGVVVGTTDGRPWKYVDGTYTELPVPADAESVDVSAINARGDVVGGYGHTTDDGYQHDNALFWPAPKDDQPLRYRLLRAPLPAKANDISNTRVIVGTVYPDGPWSGPGYLWRTWHGQGTPFLDADGEPDGASANAISPNGRWVAGGYSTGSRSVRWDLETGDVAVGPRDRPRGYVAVNDQGDAATSEAPEYYRPSLIVRTHGVRVELRTSSRFAEARVLPSRRSELTAAGEDEGLGAPDPIVWRGC